MLGWSKRYKLTHALLREYSYKGLKLAQLLPGQLGIFLTSFTGPSSAFISLRARLRRKTRPEPKRRDAREALITHAVNLKFTGLTHNLGQL